MASFSDKINGLFAKEEWAKARPLLEAELLKRPDDHWVLTQLGVTFYEQRHYEESLKLFLKSKEIVPDCPLTLWNLAGAFDALGKHADAINLYTWIVECTKSPEGDPCWESKQWADALKTDSVYRLGVCFQNLGNSPAAEFCYRQHVELVLTGAEGLYSIEDTRRRIQSLPCSKNGDGASVGLKKIGAYLNRQGSTGEQKKAPTRSSQRVNQRLRPVVKRRVATKPGQQ
jgi:tetratricopeptide (TPR) repeat protein